MKYINAKELLLFLQPPITRLSVFAAETMDAALEMCDHAFPKLEQQYHITIDFPTFKYQIMKSLSLFIEESCIQQNKALENPHAHVSEERYERAHIRLALWPKHMQKKNGENYFLIAYVTTYADILYRYLLDCNLEQTVAQALASQSLTALAKWIDDNCIRKCEYECIRRFRSNGYCALCSFMIQPLPCPMKQEISFHQSGMSMLECNCKRNV